MLEQLSLEDQSRLRSGVAITSVAQCVEELVLNSIDAKATCVAVRVDMACCKVQVVDNGTGISKASLEIVAERYTTSKCHSLQDLDEKLQHFGYRGEALASLKDISAILEIESRSKDCPQSYTRIFQNGKAQPVSFSKSHRPSQGTTVTVYDLFHRLPVRRKALNDSLELERVRQRVEAIALIHPQCSFSLRNDVTGTKVLQTHKSNSVLGAFTFLFGNAKSRVMTPVQAETGQLNVNGFIGKEGIHNKSIQFVFINDRLVLKTKIHKLINYQLSKSTLTKRRHVGGGEGSPTWVSKNVSPTRAFSERHGIFVINVTCPMADYDITFDPAKTLIEFKDWRTILELIGSMTKKFLTDNNLLVKIDPGDNEGMMSEPKELEDDLEGDSQEERIMDQGPKGLLQQYASGISTANTSNNLTSETVGRRRALNPDQIVEQIIEERTKEEMIEATAVTEPNDEEEEIPGCHLNAATENTHQTASQSREEDSPSGQKNNNCEKEPDLKSPQSNTPTINQESKESDDIVKRRSVFSVESETASDDIVQSESPLMKSKRTVSSDPDMGDSTSIGKTLSSPKEISDISASDVTTARKVDMHKRSPSPVMTQLQCSSKTADKNIHSALPVINTLQCFKDKVLKKKAECPHKPSVAIHVQLAATSTNDDQMKNQNPISLQSESGFESYLASFQNKMHLFKPVKEPESETRTGVPPPEPTPDVIESEDPLSALSKRPKSPKYCSVKDGAENKSRKSLTHRNPEKEHSKITLDIESESCLDSFKKRLNNVNLKNSHTGEKGKETEAMLSDLSRVRKSLGTNERHSKVSQTQTTSGKGKSDSLCPDRSKTTEIVDFSTGKRQSIDKRKSQVAIGKMELNPPEQHARRRSVCFKEMNPPGTVSTSKVAAAKNCDTELTYSKGYASGNKNTEILCKGNKLDMPKKKRELHEYSCPASRKSPRHEQGISQEEYRQGESLSHAIGNGTTKRKLDENCCTGESSEKVEDKSVPLATDLNRKRVNTSDELSLATKLSRLSRGRIVTVSKSPLGRGVAGCTVIGQSIEKTELEMDRHTCETLSKYNETEKLNDRSTDEQDFIDKLCLQNSPRLEMSGEDSQGLKEDTIDSNTGMRKVSTLSKERDSDQVHIGQNTEVIQVSLHKLPHCHEKDEGREMEGYIEVDESKLCEGPQTVDATPKVTAWTERKDLQCKTSDNDIRGADSSMIRISEDEKYTCDQLPSTPEVPHVGNVVCGLTEKTPSVNIFEKNTSNQDQMGHGVRTSLQVNGSQCQEEVAEEEMKDDEQNKNNSNSEELEPLAGRVLEKQGHSPLRSGPAIGVISVAQRPLSPTYNTPTTYEDGNIISEPSEVFPSKPQNTLEETKSQGFIAVSESQGFMHKENTENFKMSPLHHTDIDHAGNNSDHSQITNSPLPLTIEGAKLVSNQGQPQVLDVDISPGNDSEDSQKTCPLSPPSIIGRRSTAMPNQPQVCDVDDSAGNNSQATSVVSPLTTEGAKRITTEGQLQSHSEDNSSGNNSVGSRETSPSAPSAIEGRKRTAAQGQSKVHDTDLSAGNNSEDCQRTMTASPPTIQRTRSHDAQADSQGTFKTIETSPQKTLFEGRSWICRLDPNTGRKVFINKITGNSSYSTPKTSNEENQRTVIQIKNPVLPSGATPLLLSDSSPLQPRPKSVRTAQPSGTTSGEEDSVARDSLSDALADHLENQEHEDTNKRSIKWRGGGLPVCKDSKEGQSVESMFEDWENPVFENVQQCGARVDASSCARGASRVQQAIHPYKFTKDVLSNVKVLGQVDNKFIACLMKLPSDGKKGHEELLTVIDQHAAHERVRLERLTAAAYNEEGACACRCDVDPAVTVFLKEEEVRIACAYRLALEKKGISFSIDSTQRTAIHVHEVPACLVEKEASERRRRRAPIAVDMLQTLIREETELLKATHGAGATIPQAVFRVLCSQACHGAIKFGDPLTMAECKQLISELSTCKLPFQCAHGRPSVMPILDLDHLKPHQEQTARLQLWKLRPTVEEEITTEM